MNTPGTIIVFGLGGIGGYVGNNLCSILDNPKYSETRIVFIARGPHAEALQNKGLTLIHPDGRSTVRRPSEVLPGSANIPRADIVFLCVKGYDLREAVISLEKSLHPESIVIPLLNGADIPERIRKATEKGKILPGCIYIGASLEGPGTVKHIGGPGLIILGPGRNSSLPEPAAVKDLLKDSGLPFRWEEDPLPSIWTKYLFIAPFALTTALSGKSLGEVMENSELRQRTRRIMEETAAIAAAKGIRLAENAVDAALETALSFPHKTTTSFQRDLEAKKPRHEGELFGETIIRFGTETGVPVPYTEETWTTLLSMIRASQE